MLISRFCLFLSLGIFPLVSFAETASSILNPETPGAVYFIPPEGWRLAEDEKLGQHVKLMVVGKATNQFPPSINLSTEPYRGTLKDYLKIVKSINDAKGLKWQNLGTIQTKAGEASLSQLDTKNQWGDVRMLHAILVKDGIVYILTAASLKEEFSSHYKAFIDAIRSLDFSQSSI